MQSRLLKSLFIAATPLLAASAANAALLGQYTFDGDALGAQADGTVLSEGGTVGGSAGGTVTIVAGSPYGGNYAEFRPTDDGSEGTAAPHLSSGASIADLGIAGNQDYTLGGFIRFDNQTGDNMVFGGANGDVLHLGSRNANYHSGHWGDDIDSAGAPATESGVWHHVAWTNTASGLQTIFVDGVSVASGGDGAFGAYTNNTAEILLVGTSRNGGSFNGAIDDVRVYNNVLSQSEISAWASIPEPSGFALFGLAGFALMFRRRRRA